MSKSPLVAVGVAGCAALTKYIEARIQTHIRGLEQAQTMELVKFHQGAIDELRKLDSALKAALGERDD